MLFRASRLMGVGNLRFLIRTGFISQEKLLRFFISLQHPRLQTLNMSIDDKSPACTEEALDILPLAIIPPLAIISFSDFEVPSVTSVMEPGKLQLEEEGQEGSRAIKDTDTIRFPTESVAVDDDSPRGNVVNEDPRHEEVGTAEGEFLIRIVDDNAPLSSFFGFRGERIEKARRKKVGFVGQERASVPSDENPGEEVNMEPAGSPSREYESDEVDAEANDLVDDDGEPVPVPYEVALDALVSRTIVAERTFVLEELGPDFRSVVEFQNWSQALQLLDATRPNLTLVREVFACCVSYVSIFQQIEDVDYIFFPIRDTSTNSLVICPRSIQEALGLPRRTLADKIICDEELVAITKDMFVRKCYAEQPAIIPHDLSSGKLHQSYRALAHLVRALLHPTSQTSRISMTEARFIYALAEHKLIPAEYYIYDSIREVAAKFAYGKETFKTALTHPAVITAMCHKQKIPWEAGDVIFDPLHFTTASLNRGNAQSAVKVPSVTVEASIRGMQESIKALTQAVVALSTVGTLRKAFVNAKIEVNLGGSSGKEMRTLELEDPLPILGGVTCDLIAVSYCCLIFVVCYNLIGCYFAGTMVFVWYFCVVQIDRT